MKSTKSMMIAALVVGSLFACSTATFAQAGGGRMMMTSATMVARFQTALGDTNKLTDEELPKVTAVLDDMIKKTTDLRADTTIAPADQRTKRTAITTAASDAIKAIVTPAQFAIIQPLLQRGGGRRGGAGGGGGAPPAAAPPQA
jgi:hypothetical protein